MTDNTTKRDSDADILAIRAMLAEEPAEPLTSRRAEWVEATQRPQPLPGRAARRGEAPLDGMPGIDPFGDDPEEKPRRKARRLRAPRAAMPSLRGYRPKRKHVALALIVLLALVRPWLLVALLLLPIIVTTALFLALGHDRFWGGVIRGYHWYAARRPERAEKLRRRADAFAMRWDAILDRVPEGYVDALYFPDLDSLAEREERHARAMDDRMARLREEAHRG